MDLATVQTSDDKKHYMCVLSSWGLVADVDIESERWRSIGENRFILGELVNALICSLHVTSP